MSSEEAYPIGQRCWFPHEVEGFVSGDLVDRKVDGDQITLIFKDDNDQVSALFHAVSIIPDIGTGACDQDYSVRTQRS